MSDERVAVGDPEGEPRPRQDAVAGGFRAFLLSDIRGYSSFASVRGDEAAAALSGRFIAVAGRVLGGFGGESLGDRGDEVLFAFESPRRAVRAAVAFEQALLDATREDPSLPMPAGVGLDVGEAVVVSDGLGANAINVAARLCSLAKGGEILATREVTHLAQAVDGVRYVPQPPARLKGIPEAVAAVRVVADADDPADGFAELGLTRAAAPPVHRPRRRGAAIAAGALLLVVVAVVVALVSQGGGPAPLSVIAGDSVGAISAAGGAVTAGFRVGSSPSGVAVDQGSVWVTNYDGGTVSRIDPATHAVEPIQVGSNPTGIAVGAHAVWVANSYSGTVSRIDPADDSVQSVPVGNGPSGVAVGGGYVWVANRSDGTLSRIDPLSDTATTIRLGGATDATDVAFGERAVWVSDAADGRVLRVDPHTTRVTNIINVGNGPSAITVGYDSVWVTNNLDGTISRINARTSRVTAVLHVGSGPDAIAAGAGGVWVANEFGGTVVRIEPNTNAPARLVAVGNSPRGLAVAGGVVWVSAQASVTRVPTSGPGLTQPTNPRGTRRSGGSAYFTSSGGPTYIFPMYPLAHCGTNSVNQFIDMLYRPLYWYGNDYRPTVDYNYSIGQPPTFSDGGKTVTIKLNSWKWSDGEAVTSRDLVFWMNVLKVNVLKANPSMEWCGYAPGYFPDNVTRYSAPDPTTFVIHFNRAYNPEYVLYSELGQLTPLPLAWDRTSLSQPAPRSDNGHLPDTTKAGAAAIYKFLDGQATKTDSWTSSPLWKVVDGAFELQSFTRSGEVTLVPNPSYSGSPKPTISKLVEVPYSSDAAIYTALRSGGPSAFTVASLPPEYAPAIPTLTAEGYELNPAASYSFNYFPLNFNSSARTSPGGEPVRFVFRQAYFRRAFQHLVDQQGWITAFFLGSANPTCGPIPLSPPSPLVNPATLSTRPCAFSVAAAGQLLSRNGWNVVPGGTTTCVRPGIGAGECGAGIKAGEGISFNVDYVSGVASVHDEMKDLAAQGRRVGINLSLTTHPFNTVLGAASPCTSSQASCKWTAENAYAGWVYGPAYMPTGEPLYNPGGPGNAGSYSDPKMTQLIRATITTPAGSEATALTAYDNYAEQQLPVVFLPTQIGSYSTVAGTLVANDLGGYAANAFGFMNPEDWYFTR
jgi:peptide/nickel transport system substrate-binding protein